VIRIRNRRFFMPMCFWAAFYAAPNITARFFFFRNLVRRCDPWNIPGPATVLVLLLCFAGYHFPRACSNLRRNATSIEIWRKRTVSCYDKGCIAMTFESVAILRM
jgi:hypothetical protein